MVKFSVKEQQLLQYLKFLLLLTPMQYVSQAGLLKQRDSFINSSCVYYLHWISVTAYAF